MLITDSDLPQLIVPPSELDFLLFLASARKFCRYGALVSGAGGLYPKELCGLIVLYSLLQFSINTFASRSVVNISPIQWLVPFEPDFRQNISLDPASGQGNWLHRQQS
jgi:hypothetical protein